MKKATTRIILLLAITVLLLLPRAGYSSIIVSTSAAGTLNGVSFKMGDLIKIDDPADPDHTTSMYLSLFGSTRDLDAAYVYPDGKVLISVGGSGSITLGGVTFYPGDLVLYNPSTTTGILYLKGNNNTPGTDYFGNTSSIFRVGPSNPTSPTNEDIDAVEILANGHILLSTNGTGAYLPALGGGVLQFFNEDLVEYDPVAKVAVGIYFDGSAYFAQDENVKAFAILSQNEVLLTSYDASTIGGISYIRGDIIKLNTTTGIASLYVDHLLLPGCVYHFDAITVFPPYTLIELSTFTATAQAGRVTLEWTTESEIDNAGFNIYRAVSENGEYVQINESLIPAHGSSTQGASYQIVDEGLQNRKTYYYKLEDIDMNGSSTMHGPVSATPRFLLGIFNK